MSRVTDFSARLIAWQRQHGRHDLPWQVRDPYRVWLSEIMLQQTRVDTVLPYYRRFLERFPDLESLATADLDAVLTQWSGLGYYARARHLHAAARRIVREHGGRFPENVERLAELPGIGRSTAAAIAALAFGQRAAILDGNVKRVLCRVFGIEGWPGLGPVERRLWQLAESMLPEDDENIAAYTQGLMDLGAGLCQRKRPDCRRCPFASDCVAHREGRTNELPAPRPTKRLPEKTCAFTVLIDAHSVLLEKRPPHGIWGGLWSLPETDPEVSAEAHAIALGYRARQITELTSIEHSFSHFKLRIQPRVCMLIEPVANCEEPGRIWLPMDELSGAALPAPVRRILETWRG